MNLLTHFLPFPHREPMFYASMTIYFPNIASNLNSVNTLLNGIKTHQSAEATMNNGNTTWHI